jgi:hypothetical protein
MALSASRFYDTVGRTTVLRGVLPTGVAFFKGGMVQWDAATGLIKKPADVAGEYGIGVLVKDYPSTTVAGTFAEIEQGKIWIPFASAAQADVGDWVYLTDDAVITKTALTNGGPAGIAVDFKTGFLLVDFSRGGPKTLSA